MMFTGLIEATAEVLAESENRITIQRPEQFTDLSIGSSISVSGVCLSVAEMDSKSFTFDTVPETLRRSTLGNLKKGDTVNLERAMPISGRLEGHFVQGHIDAIGTILKFDRQNSEFLLSISVPEGLSDLIVEKGSIAIDGVSLTVLSFKDSVCTVALVPHTLEHTTFGKLQGGDSVNIETDILGKYIRSTHA